MKPYHLLHQQFLEWAKKQQLAPLMDFNGQRIAHLNLSSERLKTANFADIPAFQAFIDNLIETQNATIGIGGYGEIRPFYNTDAYLGTNEATPERRSLHLGIDIWTAAESPVYAPVSGKVHSFQVNGADKDYGATIILAHPIEENTTFYTLYGHLSHHSLQGLRVGMPVEKGTKIATLGTPNENGNWPPHLHFQVILDMLGKTGDFPGVALASERAYWLELCPNPMALIHLPESA